MYAEKRILFRTRLSYMDLYGENSDRHYKWKYLSLAEIREKNQQFDFIWLLNKVKLIPYGIEKSSKLYKNTYTDIQSLLILRQVQYEQVDDYLRRFESDHTTAELAG